MAVNIDEWIADLLEVLNINDDEDVNVEAPVAVPGYRELIQELRQADMNAVLALLNRFVTESRLELGMYGAIRVGTRGALYNQVRNFLLQEAGLGNLPTLRAYLTEPVAALPIYAGAGPGGQGESAQRLNTCVANVRDRIQRILGMLLVIQDS